MSGIYIPDMEMPHACFRCELCDSDFYWCKAAKREIENPFADDGVAAFCPLVAVPDHGRLIDADAMQDEWYRLNFDRKITDGTLAYWNYRLSQMPTIIPADKEE